jgi:nucleoside-diphosphate-sugar epimerase
VKFVVYTSYAFLYGNMHGEAVTEASEGHDLNPAFKAALRAEKAVLSHTLPGCVLRAGIVYSSEDAGAAMLSEDVLRGRSIYTGDSHNLLNWVHAADLASAVVLAAEQQPAGSLFNIVDDHPASAASFADAMSTGLGLGAVNRQAIPGFALPMMTTEMQRAILESSSRASNEKAKQSLGWKLKYPSLQSGLEQTLLGWRAEQTVKG